jgi:hypothetical protein
LEALYKDLKASKKTFLQEKKKELLVLKKQKIKEIAEFNNKKVVF